MSQHPQMTEYLAGARWFAGKGQDYDVVDVQRVATLPGPPTVTIDILTVRYATGGVEERYQMPLSHYPDEQERIGHAHVGTATHDDLGFTHAYDAVHDREAMAVYLDAFAATPDDSTREYGGLTFHRVGGHDLDTRGALDALQRRAEQLLGRVRRRQPAQGLPQGDSGPQPRHRDPQGAHRGGEPQHRVPVRLDRGRRGRPRDDPAVPAHGLRRLGPRPRQRAQPVRRGRPSRRRGGRRLRRRGRAPRRRRGRRARHPARALPDAARSTPPRWRPGCASSSTAGACRCRPSSRTPRS